jgi:hypothetical protein
LAAAVFVFVGFFWRRVAADIYRQPFIGMSRPAVKEEARRVSASGT